MERLSAGTTRRKGRKDLMLRERGCEVEQV